jgi:competence protein ComEC
MGNLNRIASLAIASSLVWLLTFSTVAGQTMRMHFIDVGQGASTLIEFPCAAVLVDTGGESNAQFDSTQHLMDYLRAFFARRTDLNNTFHSLVLTHPHIDHTRGVNDVLSQYKVLNGVTNGQESGSGAVGQKALHDAAKQSGGAIGLAGIQRNDLRAGKGLTNEVIDPVKCADVDPVITALWGSTTTNPGWTAKDFNNLNNHSVAIRVDFGKSSFLVAGDLETAGIADFIAFYSGTSMLKVDVYQVGHHGSYNGTTGAYLQALTPSIAVIAMGTPDRQVKWTAWDYGHPRKVAIDLLQKYVTGIRPETTVQVATGKYQFVPMQVTKAIYGTGWDGPFALEADVNGTWKKVDAASITGSGATSPAGSTASTAGPELININTASADQLTALPTIGPVRAKAIVRYRTAHGAFSSVDDLANVPGIGAATIERIRKLVKTN